MTVGIAPITESVQSGGQLTYRITYECSNITAGDCVAPVLRMPRPVGTDPNGVAVPATGEPSVRGNADLVGNSGADPLTIQLTDLKPGTTGEVTVSWTVPNYTTLPGTEYPGAVEVDYTDGSGAAGQQSASAASPAPIITDAKAALQVTKQTITPGNEAEVIADEEVTYRIYACAPVIPQMGALDYDDLVIVDTLPKGATFVSATGGGLYDPAAETITWSVPEPDRNSCNGPTETFEATVIYPADAFVPAAADPQAANQIVNRVHATATAIDGTGLEADGSQTHNFYGPPLTGGSNIVFITTKGKTGNTIANTNTTTRWGWNMVLGWADNAVGGVADYNRLRTAVASDRIPCIVDGVAESPAGTPVTGFPGTLAVPSDQCHTPAFRTAQIELKNVDRAKHVASVQVATWDGSTARTHTWNAPTGWNPTRAMGVYMYAKPTGGNPFDQSFDLPEGEIVTDVRVAMKDIPQGGGVGDWVDLAGTSTKAFAESGLLTMTNTYVPMYSGEEYAPGDALPSTVGGLTPYGAQANFYRTQSDPQVTKRALDSVSALKPGSTTRWQVAISNGPNANIPMRPMLVDVLPAGLEYVEDSATWANVNLVGEPTLDIDTVTIDGVERTKLTWSWPAGTELNNGDPAPTVTFSTQVTLGASVGSHTGNESQLAVLFDRDTDLVAPGTNTPVDTWDLDGDGDTTEAVGQSTVGWTVLPSSGATIEKQVKGAFDADWTTDGLTGATFDGADSQVDYRLKITNPNTLPLRDLVVYDVLPHLGDTAIGESLAGSARGTEWAPRFASVTSLPSGASVEFSMSTNPCRPELFHGLSGQPLPAGCDDDWTGSVPSDPADVTALRIVIPEVTPSADPTFVEFQMHAPRLTGAEDLAFTDPAAVANNNVAWHTYRATSDGDVQSLPAAEAPAVSVRRAAGQIGDRVWLDANRDGVQDADEKGIEGITVELRDADGNPVLDADGEPIRTVTDENGEYRFTVPLGEWSVAFVDAPAKYDLTVPSASGDDKTDSDATAFNMPTHTVVVSDPIRNGDGANVNLDLDAGLVLAQVSIVKDDGKTVVRPGEESTYTITVSNNASGAAAENVIVTDELPAELEFISASPGGSYDADTRTVTWDLGTLPAGETVSVTVTAAVSANIAPDTEIVNVATVAGPCDEDCETTDIDRTPPRVSIEKDDHKNVVGLGEELTYDLTVRNHSEVTDATGVVVTDELPAQLTFVGASGGGTYDAETHIVSWNIGELAAGDSRTVQITAVVHSETPAGDTIANTATVDTDQGCVDENDCETTDIDHTPNVKIVKDDHKTVVAPGEQLDYDVTVTNLAQWGATGVIVADMLPANATFLAASDGGAYDSATRTVTWNIGDLAGNSEKVVKVSVKVVSSAVDGDTVVNNATVTTDQGCFDEGDCKTTDTDRVDGPAVALAQTGQTVSAVLITLAAGMVLAGAVLLFVRRRRSGMPTAG
ncbi:isopeptide-forming domain-containing fimbrial protein [Microbacterium sp. ZOR0019]|uniref:isopeptide-forming domain-containing fimbrial protein n=1 Tax=Microbacterium sp. ZOR0019 TaxID=1339233 RepID=UPI000647A1A8|nr:isopeptide-forming domain-containing fimbrial protein [Microbacterium sp. ZOR0019]